MLLSKQTTAIPYERPANINSFGLLTALVRVARLIGEVFYLHRPGSVKKYLTYSNAI